jgi:hypothetical protein
MAQINGYTKITSPDSNCLVYMMKTDGTPIANIDRYIPWDDLITAIQNAGFPPPVGKIIFQEPFEDTPDDLYSGTTWRNVSEKAWGYELSVSGWVARVDVHAWSETDYAATDTVSGGAYDGETVNTVFNPEGKFRAVEGTRDSGVTSKAFETGFDADAMMRITGSFGGERGLFTTASGIYSLSGSTSNRPDGTASSGNYYTIATDSADSTSPNAAKTNDYETRPEYYTIRAWVRES